MFPFNGNSGKIRQLHSVITLVSTSHSMPFFTFHEPSFCIFSHFMSHLFVFYHIL